MRQRWAKLLSVFSALVVAAAACGKSGGSPGTTAASAENRATATAKPGESVTLEGQGKAGKIRFTLNFIAPKVGELFAVESTLTGADGSPFDAGNFKLDATMPEHGHGMITDPEHARIGPGRYRSQGMKLHMHGRWQFEATASAGDTDDRFEVAFEQPPESL